MLVKVLDNFSKNEIATLVNITEGALSFSKGDTIVIEDKEYSISSKRIVTKEVINKAFNIDELQLFVI